MCVGVLCSNKLEQDYAARICEKVLTAKSPTASKVNLELAKKIPRQRTSVQSKRIWTTSNSGGEGRVGSPNTLAKPQKVHNKSGEPDSSNDSLASTKETLGNETLQTAACSGHNGR